MTDVAALPYRPCVGVMLIDAGGRIFGGRRIDTEAPAWQMPQGGVDPGESPRDAALRELREETGIRPAHVAILAATPDPLCYDLPADLVSKLWGGRFRGQSQHWFLMRHTGSEADIDIATEHPEFCDWAWLRPAAMLAAIVPFKRAVYARVMDNFRPWLG